MKKLMFATALMASAAAFADGQSGLINAISFEGYSADATVGNKADTPDVSGGNNGMYFYFDGTDDGSSVKAFGVGDNLAAPSIRRPLYFASASPNANYLELSTEGGILWRSINTLASDTSGETPTYDLGNAKAIAATGTYFDSLVQFTPTEDGGAPELDGADKLAIWLNVDSSGATPVTNLMVRAGWVDDNGDATSTYATNYTLVTQSPVMAGQWYRLTVKAIPDVTKCMAKNAARYNTGFTGFEIYLDGVQLAADTTGFADGAAFSDGYIDLALDPSPSYGWLDQSVPADADLVTYLQSGKVFPSLLGDETTSTLQGVGFKGSGALDDIVWTEEDPFAGGTGGDDYHVSIGDAIVPITPQAGDLAALQAAIVAGGGTLDVTDVAAVNAALAAEIGSTGIPSWQALFLGLAPTEDGLEGFKIDSISFDADGKVVVTLPADVTPMVGRGVAITIKLQSTSDLGGSWTDVESAGGQDNKTFAPVTPALGETKKFYKVVVEFAASAN